MYDPEKPFSKTFHHRDTEATEKKPLIAFSVLFRVFQTIRVKKNWFLSAFICVIRGFCLSIFIHALCVRVNKNWFFSVFSVPQWLKCLFLRFYYLRLGRTHVLLLAEEGHHQAEPQFQPHQRIE